MSEPARLPSSSLRALPAVDQLLRQVDHAQLSALGIDRVTTLARQVIADLRNELQAGESAPEPVATSRENLLSIAMQRLKQACELDVISGLRRVINATGVILHTNLGRAPLSAAARAALRDAASGYCTLEYDANSGARGRRAGRVEDLLKQLTGAEDALVVNNCAAAALLVLTTLAHDGETIVSRGELVEIGGDFRVPDVLANSGTRMVEVGTTNRTKLADYSTAITEHTRLLLRIHPSNYRIVGFTSSPTLAELVSLSRQHDLPVYEDAGSGVLNDLSEFGLKDEPIISESIAAGADVVSFSGDKLLGSAQAGLLVGKHSIIQRLRKHSLCRALRADKLCLAALEATLDAHARGVAVQEVPTLRMLALTKDELTGRAIRLADLVREPLQVKGFTIGLVDGESAVGGGSGPNTHPATVLLSLTHQSLSATDIEALLRRSSPPVIARIAGDQTLLDLRTVEIEAETELQQALLALGA
jgi:L-seryl-tRNA(Ser) seleniumtransferase